MRQLGTPTLSGTAYQDLSEMLKSEFWQWPGTTDLYWQTKRKVASVLGWGEANTDLYRSPQEALAAVFDSIDVGRRKHVFVTPNTSSIAYWLKQIGRTPFILDFDECYMPTLLTDNGNDVVFVGSDDYRYITWAEGLGSGWDVVLVDSKSTGSPTSTIPRRMRHLMTDSALNGLDNWAVHTNYGTADGFPPHGMPSILDLRVMQSNTEIFSTNVAVMKRIREIFDKKLNPRFIHPYSEFSDSLYVTIDCGGTSDALEGIGYLYDDSRDRFNHQPGYQKFIRDTYKMPIFPSMFDTDAERIAMYVNQEYV